MCHSTVRSERKRRWAISRLVSPSATSSATSWALRVSFTTGRTILPLYSAAIISGRGVLTARVHTMLRLSYVGVMRNLVRKPLTWIVIGECIVVGVLLVVV